MYNAKELRERLEVRVSTLVSLDGWMFIYVSGVRFEVQVSMFTTCISELQLGKLNKQLK